MRAALLALLILAGAHCGSSAPIHPTAPAGTPTAAEVTVTPETGEKPHRLSATYLPVEDAGFHQSVLEAGAGLRTAGSRGSLRLRYSTMDDPRARILLTGLEIDPDEDSEAQPFGAGDVIEVRAMWEGPPPVGFTMTMIPRVDGERIVSFDVAAVARPRDAALVPVLRGTVPVEGSGPILITGDAGGRTVFGAIVHLELAGSEPAAAGARPHSHVLTGDHYSLLNKELAAILGDHSLPERGGEGGLALYRLPREDGDSIAAALRENGEAPGRLELRFHSGLETRAHLGRYLLRIRSEFRYRDYSYSSRFVLGNRPGGTGTRFVHGEAEPVLLVAWDAERPGYSRAVVIKAVAVHD